MLNQVKTKKITTVKEVWILPGLNKHRFYFSVYSLVFVSIETIHIKRSRQCFIGCSNNHLEFRQKYSAARCIFNSLLGVWISR